MDTKLSIQFLGANGTVTGSKHLLKSSEINILVDCGLFQGIKSQRLKNREPFPFPTTSIDYILISHAHLDHCGYLPVLVKNGFKGKIITTPPTKKLIEIILKDSAKIQEEEAKKANKEGYSKHNPATPLYTIKDVEKTLQLVESKNDKSWITLSPSIQCRFIKNGHILGSSYIEVLCFDKSILFSGDIGRKNDELLADPNLIESCDTLILESTYGDRNHPKTNAIDELEIIINQTFEKSGTLLIPSFAVERAQEILFIINKLKDEKRIPNIPVIMDSPMAMDTTDLFLNHTYWHKLNPKETYSICRNIKYVRKHNETLSLLKNDEPKIIVAASGMLTGGRILSYLISFGIYPKNTILLTGYQAEGTRGRALKEGITEMKIYGKYYEILAEVAQIDSLSGHADQSDLLDFIRKMKKKPEQIFLVHGEPQAQNILRVKMKDNFNIDAIIPVYEDEYKLL